MNNALNFENTLWSKGIELVGGIDEVGRGSFAGGVHVGCVGFSQGVVVPKGIRIDDSKKLTHKVRLVTTSWIKEAALFWGVGEGSVTEINTFGINTAIQLAASRAVKNAEKRLAKSIEHLLVDAITIQNIAHLPETHQTSIIKGDSLSLSIAAASILAKVTRDNLMMRLARIDRYNPYGWNANKGYGTSAHRVALVTHGMSDLHRTQFVQTSLRKN